MKRSRVDLPRNSIVSSWCLVGRCSDVGGFPDVGGCCDVGGFLDVSGLLGVGRASVVKTVAKVVQIYLAEISVSVWSAVEERRGSAVACSWSAWLNVGVVVRADYEAEVVVVVEAIVSALSWVMTVVGVLSNSKRLRDGAHHPSQRCQHGNSNERIHFDLIVE